MCAINPALPETCISSNEHVNNIFATKVCTIGADFKMLHTAASFADTGLYAKPTAVPKVNGHAFYGLNDNSRQIPTVQLFTTVVKCNDEELQNICNKPPYNIRCAEGCSPNSICSIIMDHPHLLCESECTCIAGDETTIPTFNEFAELE